MIFMMKRNNLEEDDWCQVGAKEDRAPFFFALDEEIEKRGWRGRAGDKTSGGRERKEKRGCGAVCIIHTC